MSSQTGIRLAPPNHGTARHSRNKACDACHYQKLKCTFSNSSSKCNRCLRLRRDCVLARPVALPRLEVLSRLLRGTKTMTITTTPTHTIVPRKAPASTNLVESEKFDSASSTISSGSDDSAATAASTAAIVTAISTALAAPSSLTSTAGPFSRPDAPNLPRGHNLVATPDSRSLNPYGVSFANLCTAEQQLIEQLCNKANFMQFFISPSMVDKMQRDMVLQLLSLFDHCKDSYIAMFGAFAIANGRPGISGLTDEQNFRRATVALEKMRECPLPKLSPNEIMPWVGFGLCLVYFSNCSLGTAATPVRRFILSHLHDLFFQANQLPNFATNSVIVHMVTVEINECLLTRQNPILMISPGDNDYIDPYMGISMTLLPLLFELAKLSHDMVQRVALDESSSDHALAALEASIAAWQPDPPPDLNTRCSSAEIAHMLMQSRVYKSMALLFILRLRYPFGTYDQPAHDISTSIIADIRSSTLVNPEEPRFVSMPYIIAALEAREAERPAVLDGIDRFVDRHAPKMQQKARRFLSEMWALRDSTQELQWLVAINVYVDPPTASI